MFDPYHKWLGIPKDRRPPTYYDLLGIDPAEQDIEVIDGAALRQIAHVRTYQSGPQAADCARILGELALARRTLTSPERRAQYDAKIAPPAPAPSFRIAGPAGPEFAASPSPSMVVTDPEPIRSRGGNSAARWLAPILTTSLLTAGFALAAWKGWIPGVRPGHRPAESPGVAATPAEVDPPTHPDAQPTRTAQARPAPPDPTQPSQVPTPSATPAPAIPPGPWPREAVVATLAPRPGDTFPDMPESIDPDTAFLDVTFEPPDAQPRLISDHATRHALNGPGRVVEAYLKVPRSGGQVALGMTRPGFLPIQDKPVNLVPGQRAVVQVRMAPEGSPGNELIKVVAKAPLVGPAPAAIAAIPPANPNPKPNPEPAPPAANPGANPGAFAMPPGRAIEGGYSARLGVLPVEDLAVTADGQHAIIAYGEVRSFNLETGRPESNSNGQIQNAKAVATSPAGPGIVATGSEDGYAAVWNINARGNWVRSRPRPVDDKRKVPVKLVEYSRDGKLLAAAIDNRVTLVKPEGSNLVVSEYKPAGRIVGMTFGPDTFWFAAERKVEASDVPARPPKPVARPALLAALAEGQPIVAIAAHPDGKRLFVARVGGELQEWDVESGTRTRTFVADATSPIVGIRLAHDGSRIAAFGDARIRVYDTETGQVEARLIGHTSRVVGVRFLPGDPRVLVSLGGEPSLRVWELNEDGGARKRPWNPADPGDLVKKPAQDGKP
ncbi:MAG: hypothetical protein U0800_22330 [Isosphaeraceae bacterium]